MSHIPKFRRGVVRRPPCLGVRNIPGVIIILRILRRVSVGVIRHVQAIRVGQPIAVPSVVCSFVNWHRFDGNAVNANEGGNDFGGNDLIMRHVPDVHESQRPRDVRRGYGWRLGRGER